jgi:hypothetical protein
MIQLVLWMLIGYGISNIVVYGKIFNQPRQFIFKLSESKIKIVNKPTTFIKEMISCMMCFGFHCGWFLSLILYSPVSNLLNASPYISWFFDACLASGTTWIINSIVEWYEENRPVYQRTIKMEKEEDDNNKRIF